MHDVRGAALEWATRAGAGPFYVLDQLQAGTMPTGLRFVYLEQQLPDGSHLELIQATEQALASFEGMRAVSTGWQGENPVRSIADLRADLALIDRA